MISTFSKQEYEHIISKNDINIFLIIGFLEVFEGLGLMNLANGKNYVEISLQ